MQCCNNITTNYIFNINSMFYSCSLCYGIYVIVIFCQHCIHIVCVLLKVGDLMLQQHVYKLCIGIDLVNDNQYWILLISSAIGECSIDPIHKVHLIWSNKNITLIMELHNFQETTSYTSRVSLWWFKTYSSLSTNKKNLGSNFSYILLNKLHG